MKKILIPGGTGAMGVYLVPALLKMGYAVDVISLDDCVSDNPNLRYIKADAKNMDFLTELLKNDYDGIVDFMIYPTKEEQTKYCGLYMKNTEHYIYLSSYRIYADNSVITETSPRLLDVSNDEILLNSGDYCIYKAQGEDIVKGFDFGNYSIIRPAITYSKRRFQLVTLEAGVLIERMLSGKTVILPEPAMNIQGTMSWAGDVAQMISRILLNKSVYGETYTVSTAEHHSWGEIAEMYKKIGGLNYITVDTETYLNILNPGDINVKQQLTYDRYFNRIIDNSKILDVTGMKQSELMPLEKGLALEFNALPANPTWQWNATDINLRMDEYLVKHR